MRPTWLNQIPWLVAALCLAAYGWFLATSQVAPVQQFAFLDFYDYYFASLAISRSISPYENTVIEDWVRAANVPYITGSDYIYPAWVAWVLQPLLLFTPRTAAAVWFVLSAGLLLFILKQLVPDRLGMALLAGLLFPPTLFTLFVGQINIFLLALLVAAWLLRDSRPLLGGLALGLVTAVKLGPGLLLPLLLWMRRTTMAVGAAITCVLAILLGELGAPGSTVRYVTKVIPELATPSARHAHPVNQSLTAVLIRHLMPNAWTQPVTSAPSLVRPLSGLVAGLLLGLCVVAAYRAGADRRAQERRLWAAGVSLIVVLSPLAWESLFVLLLLPLALLRQEGIRPWWLVCIWLLFVLQRVLDPFVNQPAAHPYLMRLPFATSWACLGALAMVLVALYGAKDEKKRS